MKPTLTTFLLLLTAAGAFAQPEVIRIACVGNSITQGSNDANAYPQKMGSLLGSHYQVKNYGIGGRTLLKKGDYPWWNEQVFWDSQDFNPHIVIIKLGTNDSKPQNWVYKDEFYPDYRDLVSVFRKNGRNPQIFVCRPVPVYKDGFGITGSIVETEIIPLIDSVRTTAHTDLIDFFACMSGHGDLFTDGIHPTAAGYALMAEYAKNAILASPSGIIRYFNSRSATVEKNQVVKVFWETTPGSQVTVNGVPAADTDSLEVTPDAEGWVTLITHGDRQDTARLKLTFLPSGTIKSFRVSPAYLDLGKGDTAVVSWTTANGSSVFLDGMPVEQNGSVRVVPGQTTVYHLATTGDLTDSREVTVSVLPSDQINRALGSVTKAGKTRRGSSPDLAVDGLQETAWQSAAGSGLWMYVDLGTTYTINRVVISWGEAYAKTYSLQSLTESGAQKTIFSTTTGDGGTDDLAVTGTGRYFRILAVTGNLPDSGYWVKEFELYGVKGTGVSVVPEAGVQPDRLVLMPAYPNPFNPEATVRYRTPAPGDVHLSVVTLLGQEVWSDRPVTRPAGEYTAQIPGRGLASGLYLCRVTLNTPTGTQTAVTRLTLVK